MVAYASHLNRLIPIVLAGLLCACSASHDVPRLHGPIPLSTAYTHLVLRSYVGEFSVLLDGKRIYEFHDPQSTGRLTLHIVELPPGNAGKQITIDAQHPPQQEAQIGAAYLATRATLPFALDMAAAYPLREYAADIFLGIVLFVIGAIACGASLIRRRGDVLALRSFGAFTLLYGVRLIASSSLPFFFGFTWRTAAFTESFITYVIPIAGWMLALRLIGNGWKSTLRLQVIVFTVFAPIGIVGDMVTGRPLSLEAINNVLVVLGGLCILFNLLRIVRTSPELRIVLAGAFVFLLFALNNNLNNLIDLPWDYDDEAPGFVAFVAALGYVATRAFVRGERESMAIDNELKTAHEIQQSILPRAMPDVEGLRFHAGYVPATSVGGDMYSFLSADAGAGVLVADVAGHGVPAALIASMVKIAVSSQARLADDPAALLGELDSLLRRDVRRAFVTATYLWFDMTRRRVAVSNAGHPPPLLYRDGTFLELGGTGVLLGRFNDAHYTTTFTDLLPGDRIVAYTDGIPEARNARDEMFGEERLKEAIGGSADDVLAAVRQWRGNAVEDADDLTIVIVDVA
jgi:sigma-B regulation protein RsbU (phosphoserine phosphatase)